MITMKEIVGRPRNLPVEHKANIEKLLVAVNILREQYGKPLQVTSGYRSLEQHLAIYAAKGITDKKKIPMKSKHLEGLAVDFADPKGLLQNWILANEDLMEEIGLYFEDFAYTKNWVHVQIVPPKSGKRFFIP